MRVLMIKLNGPNKTLQLKTEIFIFMTEHFSPGEYLASYSSSVISRQIWPFNPVLSGRRLQDCGHREIKREIKCWKYFDLKQNKPTQDKYLPQSHGCISCKLLAQSIV